MSSRYLKKDLTLTRTSVYNISSRPNIPHDLSVENEVDDARGRTDNDGREPCERSREDIRGQRFYRPCPYNVCVVPRA